MIIYLTLFFKQNCDRGGVMVNGCKQQDVRENNSRRDIQQGCMCLLSTHRERAGMHKHTTSECDRNQSRSITSQLPNLKCLFPV